MDKLTREYIDAMKKAVGELNKLLGTKVVLGKEDEKQSKFRQEVNARTDAFVAARDMIHKCFETEQGSDFDELWYRDTMVSLMSSAEGARSNLIASLEEPIDVTAGGDDVQNAIKTKVEASEDIEVLSEGIRDLKEMLKNKELKIEKKKNFVGSFAERHAED